MTHLAPRKNPSSWRLYGLPIVAAAGFSATLQARFVSEPYYGDLFTTMAAGMTALMIVAWFIYSASDSRAARWGGSAMGVAILLGITSAVGVHGFYGDMSEPRPRSHRSSFYGMAFSPPDDGYRAPAKDLNLPTLDTTIDPSSTVDLKTTSETDFPQFLGPTGHGVVHSPPLAEDWAANAPRKIWQIDLGSGLSGFSVVGNYAVTQEQRSDSELVSCYELNTGKLKWAHENKTRFSEGTAGDGPRATVTIFDGRVYSMGATGILNCLDGRTGKTIWSRDTLAEYPQNHHQYGQSSSPLVFDNMVVVALGDSPTQSLAAYDSRNGVPLWVSGHDGSAYSSPVVATLAGVKQVVTINNASVSGFNATDGKILWNYDWPGGAKCSQPVPLPPDRVYFSCAYGVGSVLLKIEPIAGGHFFVHAIWKKPFIKTQFNQVVMRDGYAYGLDDGILCCQDLATGALKWKNGRYGSGQVLLVNDLLLLNTDSGTFALARASPKKSDELTRYSLISSRVWTSPTLSNGYLIMRGDCQAACYRLPLKGDPVSPATVPSTQPSL
jgi:outer membrane protein assembly factor BamB